ncbi:hypothetical protein B0H10DRAFT_1828144, partial [Mycena sp. CBHHK59/15]
FYQLALSWRALHHPNILPLFGVDVGCPHIGMVSPWMEHGTVLQYMNTHGKTDIDKILFDVAKGLQYLYSHDMVHGDLRGV